MLFRFFSNPEKNLISFFLAALMPLMLAEAVRRHFFPSMEPWPLRGAAGCLAWMSSVGIAHAAELGMHQKINILAQLAGKRTRLRLSQFADIMFLFFSLASLGVGCILFVRSFHSDNLSGNPLVYAAIPVGSALTIRRLVERLLSGEGDEGSP